MSSGRGRGYSQGGPKTPTGKTVVRSLQAELAHVQRMRSVRGTHMYQQRTTAALPYPSVNMGGLPPTTPPTLPSTPSLTPTESATSSRVSSGSDLGSPIFPPTPTPPSTPFSTGTEYEASWGIQPPNLPLTPPSGERGASAPAPPSSGSASFFAGYGSGPSSGGESTDPFMRRIQQPPSTPLYSSSTRFPSTATPMSSPPSSSSSSLQRMRTMVDRARQETYGSSSSSPSPSPSPRREKGRLKRPMDYDPSQYEEIDIGSPPPYASKKEIPPMSAPRESYYSRPTFPESSDPLYGYKRRKMNPREMLKQESPAVRIMSQNLETGANMVKTLGAILGAGAVAAGGSYAAAKAFGDKTNAAQAQSVGADTPSQPSLANPPPSSSAPSEPSGGGDGGGQPGGPASQYPGLASDGPGASSSGGGGGGGPPYATYPVHITQEEPKKPFKTGDQPVIEMEKEGKTEQQIAEEEKYRPQDPKAMEYRNQESKALKKLAGEFAKNPEKDMGTDAEKANMGRGEYTGYKGPYNYPERDDSTLRYLAGYKSLKGNPSTLWESHLRSNGQAAKRAKYWKWSSRKQKWQKLSKLQSNQYLRKGKQGREMWTGERGQMLYGTSLGDHLAGERKQQAAWEHKVSDQAVGTEGAMQVELSKANKTHM